MFDNRTEKTICPNDNLHEGTLQFPLDASCVTEPETLEWKYKATEYLWSLIMLVFID